MITYYVKKTTSIFLLLNFAIHNVNSAAYSNAYVICWEKVDIRTKAFMATSSVTLLLFSPHINRLYNGLLVV